MNDASCKPSTCQDPACDTCGAWARVEIENLRASALGAKSIFSYSFVAPMKGFPSLYGLMMLILAVVVQVGVPLIIVVTRQPILDIDSEVTGCTAPRPAPTSRVSRRSSMIPNT
jgi:hypothetical protein